MKAQVEEQDGEVRATRRSGFTAEEREALKELGWREGDGNFDPNWTPLRQRPRWLAFVYRMLLGPAE
jgi:hypothetical protein